MNKTTLFVLTLIMLLALVIFSPITAQNQQAPKPPDETKLYVWGMPEKGTQSMILLRALDSDRVEAALLTPVVVHLHYANQKVKANTQQIDAAAGGKLLPFDLRGKDRFGRLVADVYLGKDSGWLTEFAPKVVLKDKDK